MQFPCAILCHSVFKTAPRALLFALLTTGCGGETAPDAVAGVGGAPGASGTGGNAPVDATSHEGGTGGVASVTAVVGTGGVSALIGTGGAAFVVGTGGAGGTGGAVPTTDCNSWRSPPNCGTCTITLQDYCGTTNSCQLNSASICTQFAFGSTWKRGCGYVRQDSQGDVGDRFTSIWDEASGQLVYYWFNGMMSSGCVPEKHAGTEPTCDVWTEACGGTGGSGGTTGFGVPTGGASPSGGTSAVGSGGSSAHTGGANPAGGSPGVWSCLCNCVCASCSSSGTALCPSASPCDICTTTCTAHCATTSGCGAYVSNSASMCSIFG